MLCYDNGIWLAFGRDATTGNNAIATATDPAGTWTRQQTFSFSSNLSGSMPRYADGKWVFSYGGTFYYSTDNWATYSTHTPTFQGVSNTSTISVPVYADGVWGVARQTPSSGNFTYELQYSTSLTGTWTKIAGSTIGLVPTMLNHNGQVWVSGGWSAQQAPLASTPPVFGWADDIAGTWTLPTANYKTTSPFTLMIANWIEWFPSLDQWLGRASSAGIRYAGPSADGWYDLGINFNSTLSGIQPIAVGDGWIVAVTANVNSSSPPMRIGYAEIDSFADSVTLTHDTDTSLNLTGATSNADGFTSVIYGDGVFVAAGKPSTQSVYGVIVSPQGPSNDAGWGLLL